MKTNRILTSLFIFLSIAAQSQWHQANGPYGGISRAIIFNGTDVIAASSGSGIFKSTNNGATWKPINKGLSNPTVGALVLSGTTLIAGTDGGGAFVSTDNGANWAAANNGLTNMYVWALASNGTRLFAGTKNGLFLSLNNGATWTTYSNGLTNSEVHAILIKDTFVFAATYGGGIYRSGYSNNSWVQVNTGITSLYINSMTLLNNTLFASSNNKGIFISGNNGDTWTVSDVANNGLLNDWVPVLTSGGTRVFAGTYTGVCVSENNGLSWTTVSNGLIKNDVRAIAYNGFTLYCGINDGGVYTSTNNGLLWNLCGVQCTSITSFTVNGKNVYAGAYGNYGVHLTTDSGTSWQLMYKGLTAPQVSTLTHIDSVLFAGTDGVGMFVSYNGGKQWAPADSGLDTKYAYCKALLATGNKVYLGTSNGVFSTTNLAVTWDPNSNGLTAKDVRALAYDGTSVFAGTNGGGVFKLNTGTGQWSAANTGLSSTYVYALWVNGTSLFAGTSGGVYVSTNQGGNWTAVTNGFPGIYVYAFTQSGNYMWAGTQSGIYFSKDNGVSWKAANTGLDGIATWDTRALTVSGTTVYAGTYNGAVWTRSIGDFLTGIDAQRNSEQSLTIFPNPVRDALHIDKKGLTYPVQICIYNFNGQKVLDATLTGPEETTIPVSFLSKGFYLVRVYSGEQFIGTGKIAVQ